MRPISEAETLEQVAVSTARPSQSLWMDGWHRFKKNKAAVFSGLFVVFVLLLAVFAKLLAPYSFDLQDIDKIFIAPSGEHLFGTDDLGRDLFSRVIYGARISMAIALLTAVICLVLGGVYGAVSGWVGGKVDDLMMRLVDIFMGVPEIVLMILVKVVFDAMNLFENEELRALFSTTLALSVVGWVTLARLVRGQVLQVKQMLYVEAARAVGAPSIWMVTRHVFPNILGPIIVMMTFQIPSNILYESFLSFIGLGLTPPYSSWGVLAADGAEVIETYPHMVIFPGMAIFLTMLAFNLLGDGLRDAFDPQLRGH